MNRHWTSGVLAAALLAVVAIAARGEDIWDPPWVENPNDPQWQGGVTTYQRWEFGGPPSEPTHPIFPVIVENPFGDSQVHVDPTAGHYPDPVVGPGGDLINTWHIDVDGGLFSLSVPNNPLPNARKVVFVQITSDKGYLLGSPFSDPPGSVSYPKPAINHDGTGWYTYTAQIDIPFNPPGEWIHFAFPESTNISEVVVDTICVPEPSVFALFFAGGVGLLWIGRGMRRRA